MNGDTIHPLIGRYAVNGDNNKIRVDGIFDIARDNSVVTVALLRYPEENDLTLVTLSVLFDQYAVFWDEPAADKFIQGDQPKRFDKLSLVAKPLPTPPITSSAQTRAPPSSETVGRKRSSNPETRPSTLGPRLRDARRAAKLTASQLARRIAVATRRVTAWEDGTTVPLRDELKKIAEVTKVDLARLRLIVDDPEGQN